MGNHLHIDPFSGFAGDMFVGAMLDLGLDLEALRGTLAALPIAEPYTLSAEPVLRRGIAAVDFKVNVEEPIGRRLLQTKPRHTHYHVGRDEILGLIDLLAVSERCKGRARAIVEALAAAEAQVHGMEVEDVHFHEVGAVDSIVDMLGAAVGLEILGVDSVT